MSRLLTIGWLVPGVMATALGAGCGDDDSAAECSGNGDCPAGQVCVDHRCTGAPDGGDADGGLDGEVPEAADDGGGEVDAAEAGEDAGGEVLPCGPEGACDDDMRCVEGGCLPWPEGEFDPACVRRAEPGPLRPSLQCTWDGPPDGDPLPTYDRVLHTPLVANLGIVSAPGVPARPSVIFVSDATYSEGPPRGCTAAGTLRVIDGATCRELGAATDEADRLNAPVTPAVGDLDGDGRPDIVAAGASGGLLAFRWDDATARPVRLWQSRLADGTPDLYGSELCLWNAVTLADLDDDGRPEVIFQGAVWTPDGLRLGTLPGWTSYASTGVPSPVADVDLDGVPEIVGAEAVWQWDAGAGAFVVESWFTGPGSRGFTALADFGDYAGYAGDAPGRPEVVVSGSGTLWVQSVGGQNILTLGAPSIGGGPPTVADYDGDGVPEVGAAYADHYVVYDVVLGATLWAQGSQDHSSSRTGSSVFDFNGDGQAEVVYGDECYVRIYDGATGAVAFSQARYSSTWQENPIVADVDGDYAAEIVMPMSSDCNPAYCPAWDPLFSGLRCDAPADCPGGTCGDGFCRCVDDADCGATYGCTAPLPGTPGTDPVCRARHLDCRPGLRIYRDARDRWASSRPIWNQHTYDVVNVEDDGRVPRTSLARRNWQETGLNNFRQNVQGTLGDVPGPDFTVGELVAVCEGSNTRIRARVCNRGGALIDSGVTVIFRQEGGDELCRLVTPDPVPPGLCSNVECLAPVPASGIFEAVADPDGLVAECLEANNGASGWADCLGK